jgi:hypothetical protein
MSMEGPISHDPQWIDFIQWAFYLCVLLLGRAAVTVLKELRESVATLNERVAVVITRVDAHEKRLDKHDEQIDEFAKP